MLVHAFTTTGHERLRDRHGHRHGDTGRVRAARDTVLERRLSAGRRHTQAVPTGARRGSGAGVGALSAGRDVHLDRQGLWLMDRAGARAELPASRSFRRNPLVVEWTRRSRGPAAGSPRGGALRDLLDAPRPAVYFANNIGDAVLTLPTLRALGEMFGAPLTLICPRQAFGLCFREVSPRFVDITGLPPRGLPAVPGSPPRHACRSFGFGLRGRRQGPSILGRFHGSPGPHPNGPCAG